MVPKEEILVMSNSTDFDSKVDLKEHIKSSAPDAWEYFDAPATWVLKTNREFSIELMSRYDDPGETRREQPSWAEVFPNDTTHVDRARVYYRGSPFDQKPVYRLDEFRATVVQPQPDSDSSDSDPDRFLTEYEWHLSRIMSGYHDLVEYRSALDLRMAEDEHY